MADVYVDWAESLGCFTLGAINCGIALAGNQPHPPNQYEFSEHCRKYTPPQTNAPKLQHNFTAEEIEINKKRIADIVAGMAKAKQPENN